MLILYFFFHFSFQNMADNCSFGQEDKEAYNICSLFSIFENPDESVTIVEQVSAKDKCQVKEVKKQPYDETMKE